MTSRTVGLARGAGRGTLSRMTSLRTRFAASVLVVALALLGGCSESAASAPEGPFAPGISGEPLVGRIEVIAIGEDSRTPIDGAVIDVRADGTSIAESTTPGYATFEDARLEGPVTITVRTEGTYAGTTTWAGVAADRVVIPVARAGAERSIEGRVLGADTLGAASVLAGPLVAPHITRPSAIDDATPGACVDEGSGACRFRASAPLEVDHVAAILRDASGAAIGFGIGEVGEDGSVEVSVLDPASRVAAIPLAMEGPLPTPPIGLDAVVGVPGIATSHGISLLPQTAGEGGVLAVPELSGALADATWWVMAQAYDSANDTGARSVVLLRHLSNPDAVGRLPAFLELPEVTVARDTGVTVGAVDGAAMIVIECEDASGDRAITTVLGGASGPVASECVGAVRVRAVDATGATGSALDLDGVERVAMRFSEVVVTR
ncbi:Hypothetical protein I5071_75470 [Sandaracinus amylolyticus]|nr:Hypothetical protein I5071_75470 [Sandaracinus amylolyticus]